MTDKGTKAKAAMCYPSQSPRVDRPHKGALVTTTTYDTRLPIRGDLPILGNDNTRTYRLGIMGGTFDPIHNGHLVCAETAFDELELDMVVFMPAGSPAFKQGKNVSPGEDRYAMTLLATSDNPHFLASRFEIDHEGITYTAETLYRLRVLYPSNVDLYFITGADAIAEILEWKDAGSIAKLAHLVGASRPGWDLSGVRRTLEMSPYEFDVTYLEVPALAISSSYLRGRVSEGKSLRYLTPDVVTGYIHKHELYGALASRYGAGEPIYGRTIAKEASHERSK